MTRRTGTPAKATDEPRSETVEVFRSTLSAFSYGAAASCTGGDATPTTRLLPRLRDKAHAEAGAGAAGGIAMRTSDVLAPDSPEVPRTSQLLVPDSPEKQPHPPSAVHWRPPSLDDASDGICDVRARDAGENVIPTSPSPSPSPSPLPPAPPAPPALSLCESAAASPVRPRVALSNVENRLAAETPAPVSHQSRLAKFAFSGTRPQSTGPYHLASARAAPTPPAKRVRTASDGGPATPPSSGGTIVALMHRQRQQSTENAQRMAEFLNGQ